MILQTKTQVGSLGVIQILSEQKMPSDSAPALIGYFDSGAVDSCKWP